MSNDFFKLCVFFWTFSESRVSRNFTDINTYPYFWLCFFILPLFFSSFNFNFFEFRSFLFRIVNIQKKVIQGRGFLYQFTYLKAFGESACDKIINLSILYLVKASLSTNRSRSQNLSFWSTPSTMICVRQLKGASINDII